VTTNANPAIYSHPVSKMVKCLPEGKRIITVIIDFTSIPFVRGDVTFPEFTYNPTVIQSSTYTSPIAGYQKVDVELRISANGTSGLSEVRAMIYKWAPYYTLVSNATPALYAIPLCVTNTQTLQTVALDSEPTDFGYGSNCGCVPFYGGDNTTARFLLPTPSSNVTPTSATDSFYGKVIAQFLNFDPVGYFTALQGGSS
jgi:hypothetical protein